MNIKPLNEIDHTSWLSLWKAYQTFYQVSLSEEINSATWQRLTHDSHQHMYGFAAVLNGKVVGIVHVIEHESCWTLAPYAYLQDLYTHADFRGLGVAKALIEQVRLHTVQRGCDRVYWLTHQDNDVAQALYDRVARKTGFIQYRI